MTLEDRRRQYTQGGLQKSQLPADPMLLFDEWLTSAIELAPADWVEPYGMTLATASPDGHVAARVVLLRGYHSEHGFVFYTNYQSAKARHLEANPRASAVFHWGYLERQVRIGGSVTRVSREMSEVYFHKRPRGSQISAAISQQSEVIGSRKELETKASRYEAELADQEVPLPEFWGGYAIQPNEIEFWQGRENRLHDRFHYQRMENHEWNLQRLSP